MPELLLALDVGTSTARCGLFSPDGVLLTLARERLASHSPRDGCVEQEAEQVWRAARKVMRVALAASGRAGVDVAAIGVTTQRTSAVVWDRLSGRALSPLVIWSDLRGQARAAELGAAGYFLAPQQAAAKLESIVASLGETKNLAWGNIDSYLIWRLSGGAVHSTDASQAWPTGYYNPAAHCWNDALITHQGLDLGMFPTLVDTWGPIAQTTADVLGARVPITADIADQQSALVAHGGAAKITFGTSATLDVGTGEAFVYKSPSAPPFVVSSVGGHTQFCMEGMVLSAGAALDWARGVWALGGHDRFEALAMSVADAGGAAFLPALQGLGAPHGDPARRAALTGLGGSVTRAHIARATMEGVAFRVREAVDHVFSLVDTPQAGPLGVDGGLCANATFLQIQADLLGREIRRHEAIEATACGAALCAGLGAGVLGAADVAAFGRYDRTFEPRLSSSEADERLARWRALVL